MRAGSHDFVDDIKLVKVANRRKRARQVKGREVVL